MTRSFPATSMPDRDWWQALWPDVEAVLRTIGITPDMTVLDLCCGDGYFTAPLASLVGGNVHALDLDPKMIDQARDEVARAGGSVRQWVCADARQVAAHLAEPVDYVLMANTFHGVPDKSGLVRAVRSALRPGGLFGIINWHARPREETIVLGMPRGPATSMRMTPETLRKVVEAEGFRQRDLVELRPYHYGAVFAAMPGPNHLAG